MPKRARAAEGADADAADAAPRASAPPRIGALGAPGTYQHTWNEHRDSSITWTEGKWTPEEDALLVRSFEDFCDAHGLVTPEERARPLVELGSLHPGAWLFVASHFRHRTVRAILRRAVRLLHPDSHKGAWDAAERAELVRLVGIHGREWKRIGGLLSRLPQEVEVVYRRLVLPGAPAPGGAPPRVPQSGLWGASEEAALLKALSTPGIAVRTPSGAFADVSWGAVSALVGGRTPSQCMSKWADAGARLLAGRAAGAGSSWDARADRRLVDALVADGADASDGVAWFALLPGCTARDARARWEALVKRHVPGAKGFADALDALDAALTGGAGEGEVEGEGGGEGDGEGAASGDAPRKGGRAAAAKGGVGVPDDAAAAKAAKKRAKRGATEGAAVVAAEVAAAAADVAAAKVAAAAAGEEGEDADDANAAAAAKAARRERKRAKRLAAAEAAAVEAEAAVAAAEAEAAAAEAAAEAVADAVAAKAARKERKRAKRLAAAEAASGAADED